MSLKAQMKAQDTWMTQAACRGKEPESFFPGKGSECEAAIKVCNGCPVREECLEFALSENIKYGVWGGMSERARRRFRAERYSDVA